MYNIPAITLLLCAYMQSHHFMIFLIILYICIHVASITSVLVGDEILLQCPLCV